MGLLRTQTPGPPSLFLVRRVWGGVQESRISNQFPLKLMLWSGDDLQRTTESGQCWWGDDRYREGTGLPQDTLAGT